MSEIPPNGARVRAESTLWNISEVNEKQYGDSIRRLDRQLARATMTTLIIFSIAAAVTIFAVFAERYEVSGVSFAVTCISGYYSKLVGPRIQEYRRAIVEYRSVMADTVAVLYANDEQRASGIRHMQAMIQIDLLPPERQVEVRLLLISKLIGYGGSEDTTGVGG